MSSFFNLGFITFNLLITSFLISSCTTLNVKNESNKELNSQTKREPKMAGLFEWLFGPPVTPEAHENSSASPQSTTHLPFIHLQLSRNQNNSHNSHPNKAQELAFSNDLERAEGLSYNSQVKNQTNLDMNSSFGFPLAKKIYPKPRNMRSADARNARQITDIQQGVRSEIDESSAVNEQGLSQINRQQDLDAIDRVDKNLTTNLRNKRKTSSTKFRQLNIPYSPEASNNRINTLSKRQLLLTPAEQQMLILRQQQDYAAAMLQQPLLNMNRYNNRYIDDYYDDDSSYEDSDEFYDQFNQYGMRNPMADGIRQGPRFPPMIHPYGIGRRSLPDSLESNSEHEAGFPPKGSNINNPKRFKSVRKESLLLGPISKAGRWETIEDYDLSSDFNKLQGKMGLGSRASVPARLGESHSELDEKELNDESGKGVGEDEDEDLFIKEKGRSSLAVERQDTGETTASNSNTSTTSILPSSTSAKPDEITVTSESSTSPPSTEETTPEESTTTGSTDSEEENVTTTGMTTKRPPKSTTTTKPLTTTEALINVPPYRQTLNCRCGMQSVRGHELEVGTVVRTMVNPWLVSVQTRRKHLCSGSIINNKYILTAKNCVQGIKGLIVTTGMGSGIPTNFTVVRINEHESKNIALLKVKPAISPNFAMRPVCLPIRRRKNPERAEYDTGTLVTFKRPLQKGNPGLQLVQTEVPMLSRAECTMDATGGSNNEDFICPGPPGSMKCGGDAGGVLQVYQSGYSYEQIAVSKTVGCRANKTPGIYTDIRNSVKWILYNTKDARYCRKPKVTPKDLINAKKLEPESNVKEPWNEGEEEEEQEEETF